MKLQDYVTELFLDDFSELPLLYNFIDCLMFPSLYEGFGMPIAEALACGTPVVISDRASLPEAGCGLALTVEPNDCESLADALSKSLHDEELIQRVAANGPNKMERFSMQNIAHEFNSFYSALI